MNLMSTWRLPNGRGSASSRWLPANFSGCGRRDFSQSRSSFGSKPPLVEAMRTALAPGVCPVLRYSDEREWAFSGLVRSRFSEEQAEKGNGPAMTRGHL